MCSFLGPLPLLLLPLLLLLLPPLLKNLAESAVQMHMAVRRGQKLLLPLSPQLSRLAVPAQQMHMQHPISRQTPKDLQLLQPSNYIGQRTRRGQCRTHQHATHQHTEYHIHRQSTSNFHLRHCQPACHSRVGYAGMVLYQWFRLRLLCQIPQRSHPRSTASLLLAWLHSNRPRAQHLCYHPPLFSHPMHREPPIYMQSNTHPRQPHHQLIKKICSIHVQIHNGSSSSSAKICQRSSSSCISRNKIRSS